jgi:phage I-like protein
VPKQARLDLQRPAVPIALTAPLLPEPKEGEAAAPPSEFRIFAFGRFESSQGPFEFTSDSAKDVMEAYRLKGTAMSADYEHRALHAAYSGDGVAPAAAWFKLAVREDGLWAVDVKWTPRAAQYLTDREYRYFSPAFEAADQGENKPPRVKRLVNVALTNLPATRDMEPLAASEVTTTPAEEPKTMKTVLTALSLAETATEAEALVKVTALSEQLSAVIALSGAKSVSEALGVFKAWSEDVKALAEARAKLATIEAESAKAKLENLLDGAVKAGKVPPAERAALAKWGEKDITGLSAYIEAKATVVTPASTVAPASEGKTDDESLVKRLSVVQVQLAEKLKLDKVAYAKKLSTEGALAQ